MDFDDDGYDGGLYVCDETEGIWKEVEMILSIEENGRVDFNEWSW